MLFKIIFKSSVSYGLIMTLIFNEAVKRIQVDF